MTEAASRPPRSLRERARDAVREQIAEIALELFAERGFEHVTVEEIATAAGISARSFFRYFPNKEDVVIADPVPSAEVIRDTFAARPTDEPIWTSLRVAFDALVKDVTGAEAKRGSMTMKVITNSPSLRAHSLEKHHAWATMLTPLVLQRLDDGPGQNMRAETLIRAALACFDAALAEWAAHDGSVPFDPLLDQAFDEVGRAAGGASSPR
ncbi:TetR family transcriptional regulator [Conexibacter stalactiti]|uniref:TetR family transcriptional regulator n=1 Tax=Conexibacter stalactiti TaxID=1940611 RepID=A0ABU4HPR1_9ACTN|nr:TetR family transcriptional regulator [Conexibacter stalactiti]MDW5595271.1 TetR family transcriptional regulator [Conexibacter stalactiti]MEC5035913.1 TetR family transcriptional regulator [Conexibacter stalactiti]